MQAGTDIDLATNDLGPLAWVLDELRKSLDTASAALRRFVRDTTLARGTDMASVDGGQLRIARQQLHQAVGALEMVGLPAPALILRSMEAAVQKFVERPELCSEQAAAKVERAGYALTEYLEGVLLGKPASAVGLFPQYKDTQEIAGADRIHPADLWTPEWRWQDPQTGAASQPQSYEPGVRARLDQAVLKLVKSGDPVAASELSRLSLGLAAGQPARQPKIFWKVCAGFFEAVGLGLLPLDLYVKRAGSRILLQYASLAKGDLGVSDRLVQDLVFFCSQAVPATAFDAPALTAVRHAWNLGMSRPVDYTVAQYGRFDPVLLSQARKRIAIAKETWASLSGGDANKLKVVADQFHLVGDSLVKLHAASAPLAQSLGSTIDTVVRGGRPPSTEIAMEVATAILYLEAAFEDLDPADSQLAGRTARLGERLEQVRQGGQPEALEPWMEELYRRVSDRQTMGSVVGELRGTLGELEKLLDQYFRDVQDKSPLRDAPMHLQQMRGVLSVLGLDQAAHAVQRMRDAVEEIIVTEIDEEKARAAGTFDKLGNSLGALGFLIDMLNYQPALAKKLFVFDEASGELRPLMGRAPGVRTAHAQEEPPALAAEVDAVASSLGSEGAPQQISQQLEAIATRAALEDQPAIADTAREAAAAVTQDPGTAAAALQQLASAVRPASEPDPAAAPAADFEEDELLDIFLEEAREVVGNGLQAIEALVTGPADLGELTILRRAFHTLKGSSRMVGLDEFGEAAWSMEQVLNTWLADQKPASDELRVLAREAMQGFAQWVEDISAHRDAGWRASMFRSPADAMRLQGKLVALALPAPGFDISLESAQVQPAGADAAADATVPLQASAVAVELPAAALEASVEPAAASDVADASLLDISFDLPEPAVETAAVESPAMPGAAELTLTLSTDEGELSFELPEAVEPVVAEPTLASSELPAGDGTITVEDAPDVELSFDLAEGLPAEDAGTPAQVMPEPLVVDLASMDLPSLDLDESAQRVSEPSQTDVVADPFATSAVLGEPEFLVETASAQEQEQEQAPVLELGSIPNEVVELTDGELPAEFAALLNIAPEGTANSTVAEALALDAVADAAPVTAAEDVQAPVVEPVGFEAQGIEAPFTEATFTEAAFTEATFTESAVLDADVSAAAGPSSDAPPPEASHEEHVPALVAADDTSATPETEPLPPLVEADDQIKVIGSLRIGIPLYNVYLNEADEWSRRLATELAEWALETGERIPDSTPGLAHALAGSSATVGFESLSDVARALESALLRAQRLAYGTPQHARAFNDAADEIRRLLHQFAAGFLKEPHPAIVAGLEALKLLDIPERPDFVETPFGSFDDLEPDEPAQAAPQEAAASQPAPEAASEAPSEPTNVRPLFAAPVARPHVAAALDADDTDDLDVADAVDPDLFGIFEEEALELMPHLGSALRQWIARPENRGARDQVLRTLHTLKGSARLAGALRLGELAHRMESDVEALGSDAVSSTDIEPLLQRLDAIQGNFDTLRATGGAPVQVLPAAIEQPVAEASPQALEPEDAPATEAAADPSAAADLPVERGPIARPATLSLAQQRASTTQSVRVRAHLLDRLMNQAGEVMITRTRLEAELRQLRGALTDLTGNLDRLRAQLRDIELQAETQMQSRLAQAKDSAAGFDPLEFDRFTRVQELTRMMAESVNDVATVQRTIQRVVESTEDDLVTQARLTRELQRDLLRTRMVEFEGISDRLYRVVRLASKETAKQVKLDILGGTIEMDRGVLDRMTPAFEHLLRNCVAHGIEGPDARTSAGKAAAGNIVIELQQEGNDVSVEFRDDGAGLDLERIRQKAVQQGLIGPDQPLGDDEAAQLIFMPGFSTATQVTELAGRGIGMDVVRAEVNALGGRIETRSQAGQGTSFRLVLPLTTAVTQVVMLRAGNLSIGVPASLVEIVRRTGAAELEQAYASGTYEFQGEQIPFHWCGALLQASGRSTEPAGKTLPVVIFRSAAQRVALHVDEVLGNQEVVVKNLGPQLSRLPGLAGMTVLASGAVVLIYNPVALGSVYGEQARSLPLQGGQGQGQGSGDMPAQPVAAADAAPQVPLILVVDDSITVRRVTQRLLQREGYRVALAADGLQALEKLAEEKPAVVLSDIEMPRMDGFDLARNIRVDEKLKGLPIIMITSRIAEKHREHARELGVDHYLGKPYSEEELLALLRQYCAAAALA